MQRPSQRRLQALISQVAAAYREVLVIGQSPPSLCCYINPPASASSMRCLRAASIATPSPIHPKPSSNSFPPPGRQVHPACLHIARHSLTQPSVTYCTAAYPVPDATQNDDMCRYSTFWTAGRMPKEPASVALPSVQTLLSSLLDAPMVLLSSAYCPVLWTASWPKEPV